MSEIWDTLRFLRRREEGWKEFTDSEKLDLLAQMTANLIDEVCILKSFAQRTSNLSREAWEEEYIRHKMALLYNDPRNLDKGLRW